MTDKGDRNNVDNKGDLSLGDTQRSTYSMPGTCSASFQSPDILELTIPVVNVSELVAVIVKTLFLNAIQGSDIQVIAHQDPPVSLLRSLYAVSDQDHEWSVIIATDPTDRRGRQWNTYLQEYDYRFSCHTEACVSRRARSLVAR